MSLDTRTCPPTARREGYDVNSGTATRVDHPRGGDKDANSRTFVKRHVAQTNRRDVRELDDAKAAGGLARPHSRKGVPSPFPQLAE